MEFDLSSQPEIVQQAAGYALQAYELALSWLLSPAAWSQFGLLVAASLLTAAAVAVSGLIAFVGLIVPHAVRLMFGASFRVIVPLSIFAGAGFLVLCDLAARTILSPAEIPIGVITAFFGAPFFIVVLRTVGQR